jgi:hypothetical protein
MIKSGYGKEEIQSIIKELDHARIQKKEKIEILQDKDLPREVQFYNQLQVSSGLLDGTYLGIREGLVNKKDKNGDDFYKMALIYSHQGEYEKSNQYLKQACEKKKEYCQNIPVFVIGYVTDDSGQPIEGVKVTVLAANKSGLTDKAGKYSLKVGLQKMRKDRVSYEKVGYSKTFSGITLRSENEKKIYQKNIILKKSTNNYLVNLSEKSIDNGGRYIDGKFIFKTLKSKYIVPENA